MSNKVLWLPYYVQFNPSKQARFGIKVYKLCNSSTSYCYLQDKALDPDPSVSKVVILNSVQPILWHLCTTFPHPAERKNSCNMNCHGKQKKHATKCYPSRTEGVWETNGETAKYWAHFHMHILPTATKQFLLRVCRVCKKHGMRPEVRWCARDARFHYIRRAALYTKPLENSTFPLSTMYFLLM